MFLSISNQPATTMSRGQPRRSLVDVRIGTVSALFVVGFWAISSLAGLLAQNVVGKAAAFVTGIVVTAIIASPIEWIVHRYIYHRSSIIFRRVYAIHSAHHHLYFPPWAYVTHGPAQRISILGTDLRVPQGSKWDNAMTYFAHFVFYMTVGAALIWTPAWLLSQSVPFLLGTIFGTILFSNLFIIVHDATHRPGCHSFIERRGWFRFLDEHHYIHHANTEVNFNFLLPLADWLFGTLRRTLTKEEIAKYGSRDAAAKLHGLGIAEPGNESTIRAERRMLSRCFEE